MKCEHIAERLGEYWDLPEDDAYRVQVDEHIRHCEACLEEFEIWRESRELIQSTRSAAQPSIERSAISAGVMERIYKDESWRMPVAFRSYSLSLKVRRNVMACFALFMAVFVVSFAYSFHSGALVEPDISHYSGIIETAHAKSAGSYDKPVIFADVPIASISAPSVLTIGPIQATYTDYLLALSIIGLVITLLLMNWLSRLRA